MGQGPSRGTAVRLPREHRRRVAIDQRRDQPVIADRGLDQVPFALGETIDVNANEPVAIRENDTYSWRPIRSVVDKGAT